MKPTYFISDLHLSHQTPKVVDGFFNFLANQASSAKCLYILGDFFDAWIGDDEDDPLVLKIKEQIKQFSNNCPTYFLHGNRDFLIGERFATETGVTLLPEQTVINLYGHPTLLMHGDTLCTRDAAYMQFRTMVRAPQWQQQVLSMPLQQRRLLAADLRQKSQSMNAVKAEDIMDVTPEEIINVMTKHQVDLLIHGHTHRPAIHQLNINNLPARRCVLGDWHESGWYARAKPDSELELELELVQFDI